MTKEEETYTKIQIIEALKKTFVQDFNPGGSPITTQIDENHSLIKEFLSNLYI